VAVESMIIDETEFILAILTNKLRVALE